MLSEKYGGKWVFGIGCLLSAILTLATPLAADAGIEVLVALRALEGLGIGVAYPAMHTLMSKWVPLPERSRTVAVIAAGANPLKAMSARLNGGLFYQLFDQTLKLL